jgi:RimJ/RimL family protein N-acetyltransferase
VQPDWPIETERLTLRPFEERDFEGFAAMQGDPENARWLYNEPRSREEARERFDARRPLLEQEGDWLACAVVERETGDLVGDLVFNWASKQHRGGEIGFIFAREHHGKGYATESARALLGWVFGPGGFHRVIGRTEPRNTGSARVLEKLGMRLEAHFVENEWVKGEWSSELVYAILEREWR